MMTQLTVELSLLESLLSIVTVRNVDDAALFIPGCPRPIFRTASV